MDDWQPILTAPFDRVLQLSVIEKGEIYALVFPCRRTRYEWAHAENREAWFRGPDALARLAGLTNCRPRIAPTIHLSRSFFGQELG